jgi:hypothetical protein
MSEAGHGVGVVNYFHAPVLLPLGTRPQGTAVAERKALP